MGEPVGLALKLARPTAKPDRGKTKSAFRADIQGLRAFAVLVVILDHLVHWPSGGFIGVDVFFVISGFLITGHLLREYGRTGHISFVDFYKKRVKRIMPAAVLVIIATIVASWAIFNPARLRDTIWDGVWGLLFGANWRFGVIGTDYFQADGPVSPLQHYWSLAVEEQFYFIWPWLLLAAFFLFLRGPRKTSEIAPRIVAGTAIVAISVASLAWAIWETSTNPGLAYFSTLSRGWELGVGALLAVIVPILNKIPRASRPILAWLGIAGLVASLFVISAESAFPAPAALLPVLSASAVIAAGTGRESHGSLFILTNPVSSYLGDISYSLYLWHFPVIILTAALMPDGGWAYYLIAVSAIALSSIFAYHLVEDPIRRSSWLSGLPKRKNRDSQLWTPQYQNKLLALLAVVTVACVAWAFAPKQPAVVTALPPSESAIDETGMTPEPVEPAHGPELAGLQEEIQRSLDRGTWPELAPSVQELGFSNWFKDVSADSCVDVDSSNIAQCYFDAPGAQKTAVLLGDSYGMAWTPGVRAALNESGYNLQLLTRQQCPAADLSVLRTGNREYPECDEHREWALSVIRELQPDLLIMASSEETSYRLASEAKGSSARQEFAEGTKRTIDAVAGRVGRTLVLASPPTGKNLQECMTNVSTPNDCVSSITGAWNGFVKSERKAAESANATYIDTRLWFCTSDGMCPSFVGDTPVRVDGGHLTLQYSARLAEVFRAEVLETL